MEFEKISELLSELGKWETVIFLIIVAFFGILGSFAKKFTTPPKDPNSKKSISYIIVGSMAAIAILLVITPTSAVMVVSLSIAAGYAGRAVLDNIGNKLTLAMKLSETEKDLETSKQKAKKTRNKIMQIKNDVKQITGNFDQMGAKIPQVMAFTHPGGEATGIPAGRSLKNELSLLEGNLDSLLMESATYSNFVIILDEDFERDRKYYKVVFESNDLQAARSQTQYENVIAEYPRAVLQAKRIESLKLEHTETGISKNATIYELS
jgi:hypothetical protein